MDRELLLRALGQRLRLDPEQVAALGRGDMEAALAGRIKDPMAQLLLSSMGRRQPPSTDAEEVEEDGGPDERAREGLRAANQIIGYIANVLGACRCFGANPSCRVCAGHGGPGARPSRDIDTLLSWIVPTLEMHGLRVITATPRKKSPKRRNTEERT